MAKLLAIAALVLGSVVLAAAAYLVNIRQGCALHDAPYAEWECTSADDRDPGRLRDRLRVNPADIDALKLYAMQQPASERTQAVAALSALWPEDRDVLGLRAEQALRAQQWSRAAAPLVHLVQYHRSEPAAVLIAKLAGAGQTDVLTALLDPRSNWPDRVVEQLPKADVTPAAITPLVAAALQRQAISRKGVGAYILWLKSNGSWSDAYALWLAMHQEPVPLLYNGGFDRSFTNEGFDWEIQPQGPRAGAVVERVGEYGGDARLQVRLSGKRFRNPLVRQYLFIGGSPHRLRGKYLARQMRMEKGLAWVARCVAGGDVAGRSPPLQQNSPQFRDFEFLIAPPPDCGPVVSLQLETAEAFEAETGALAQVEFEGFSLEALPATAQAEPKTR
jgi:hypothetical protein